MPIIISNRAPVVINCDKNIKPMDYTNNDLKSVYSHYDPITGKNVITDNVLRGEENGKSK